MSAELRRSLSLVKIAWLSGAVWMYITTGAVLTRYAQLVGLPNFGFGLLAALPFVCSLAQLPSSLFLERYGHRKAWFITLGIIHRSVWLVIAALPWLAPPDWQWPGFLLLIGLSWVAGQMVVPAWVSWMADLVPGRIRGRYFSRRTQLGQLVGLGVTLLTGLALDQAAAAGPVVLQATISAALVVAGLAGIGDFLLFLPVQRAVRRTPDPQVTLASLLRAPLADANFRRFLAFTATLTFGIGYLAQFVWLFVFDVLECSNTQANLLLLVAPLVTLIIVTPLWGRLLDRVGRKPLLVIAGLAVVPGSVGWIFMARDPWWWWYPLIVLVTAAWPAIELANFNILLSLRERAHTRDQASAYVAVASVTGALAGALSGLFGGLIAEWLRDWRGEWLGYPLTYHSVLFALSGVLRVLALGWLIGFKDPESRTTRTALRYMGTTLYSNLQQAVFLPIRFFSRLARPPDKMGKS